MPINPSTVAVLTTLFTRQPVSRADIARRTGLSGGAVTKAVRPFLTAGYLEELSGPSRAVPRGMGRPASPLAIRADREYFVGIKVTADELIGLVVDLGARVRHALHRPLASGGVPEVVDELIRMVEDLRAASPEYRERCHSLGIGISGDVDRDTGLVRYSPFLDWRDVPLGELLGAATGLNTVIENDVKALATAEWWFGEGVGASSFALVTIGAGIGCALMVNGDMVAGAHGVAGEIAHLPVGDKRVACPCGGRGCIQAIASERAIVERVRADTGRPDLTIAGAIDLAHEGDPAARAAFDDAGHAIGLALATVANLVGPQRIIVSGEGLAAYDLFTDQIRRAFADQAFGAAGRCALVIRPLSFEDWARGAATVSIQRLFALAGASPRPGPRA